MTAVILAIAILALAWANGANDNFKGVATLYGAGIFTFERARILATVSTLLGSLVSLVLAEKLLTAFSGKGLIPEACAVDAGVLLIVGGAAALTILLATRLGMPTSTTHALFGGLAGVGLVANSGSLPWGVLWNSFALPMLLSPVLAVLGAGLLYVVLRGLRSASGVTRETCVCVGEVAQPATGQAVAIATGQLEVRIDRASRCEVRYLGSFLGLKIQTAVDGLHELTAAAVCFCRAVNDTPKIAALLLVARFTNAYAVLAAVAAAMVVGGWVQGRRVAETMSKRITELSPGQGLTANLMTSGLVLAASLSGLPVSTTHVACGSLFGIGLLNRHAHWKVIGQIVLAWITTLPCAALLAAGFFYLLKG